MNRIISINIKGMVFQIEEDAYEVLKSYLDKLKFHFRNTESSSEIIDDIEYRLAEMLSEKTKTRPSISMTDVEEVISRMGNPTDFGDQEQSQFVPAAQAAGERYKRLFRDPDNKIISGVCGGMGAYFNADPLWFRIGFLIAFFTFGTGLVLYIILAILLPVARTAADKLEMRGEKVNIDNIERTVRDEFEKVKKNFTSDETRQRVRGLTNTFTERAGSLLHMFIRIFSIVIGIFIILIAFAVIVTFLFGIFGLYSDTIRLPFYPFFPYLFENSILYSLAAICLCILFFVPLLGLVLGGLRLLSGNHRMGKYAGRTFGSLWLLALVSGIVILIVMARDWREEASLTETIQLSGADTIYIGTENYTKVKEVAYNIEIGRSKGVKGFYVMEKDSLKRTIFIDVVPTDRPQGELEITKSSNGSTYDEAVQLADEIRPAYSINGGKLLFNPYYGISKNSVWKDQSLHYVIRVPKGKIVVFGQNTGKVLDNVESKQYVSNYKYAGRTWIMKESGLESTSGDAGETSDAYDKTYDFKNFSDLRISGHYTVEIIQGEKYSVGARYNNDQAAHIHIEQKGGRLDISYDNWDADLLHSDRPEIVIVLPALSNLQLSGAVEATLRKTDLQQLSVELDGAAQLNGEIDVKKLDLELSGAAQCTLEGKSTKANVELSGASGFNGEKMETSEMSIDCNGVAKGDIYVTERLDAEASGASQLVYHGKPRNNIRSSASGAAQITEEE